MKLLKEPGNVNDEPVQDSWIHHSFTKDRRAHFIKIIEKTARLNESEK